MTQDAQGDYRVLIRGARLLTQDDALGELRGDVLIQGRAIAAVAPHIQADAHEVIDASDMIVLPGFIDTHRHTWETPLRQIGLGWDFRDYLTKFFIPFGELYAPDDVYAGNLLGAVSALDSGITTLRDESNIQNSPEHTDAAIQGLRDAGLRAVFDYGWPGREVASWLRNSVRPHPADLRRVRRDVLSSDDALVTLSMMVRGPEMTSMDVARADLAMMRELGLRGCLHAGCGEHSRKNPGVRALHEQGLLGPDLTFIHCCTCTDEELEMIKDSGGSVSIASTIDANMPGIGLPATGRVLRVGLRPSLSIDVEVSAACDMFTAMRAALTAQQMELLHNPELAARSQRFDARDLLSFATLEGARACGIDHKTGSLTPKKQADLIMVRASDLNLAPATDAANALVGGAHPGNVDTVMVAGRFVKRHGKLVEFDSARAVELAAAARDRLIAAHRAAQDERARQRAPA